MAPRVIPAEALAAFAPEPVRVLPPVEPRAFNGTLGPWAEKALREEIAAVAGAVDGARHLQLFKSACALFEAVAGGALPDVLVEADLRSACATNGMLGEGRGSEIDRVIEDARERGRKNPRRPEARPEPRTATALDLAPLADDASPEEPEWLREGCHGAAAEAPLDDAAVGSIAVSEVPERAPERDEEPIPELPAECWRPGFIEFRQARRFSGDASGCTAREGPGRG